MFDNILFIDPVQATMGALARVMDFARTHHFNDPVGWDNVIKALNWVLTHNDMKRLVTRSNDNKVWEIFERLGQDVYHTWKASFIGLGRYHLILRGRCLSVMLFPKTTIPMNRMKTPIIFWVINIISRIRWWARIITGFGCICCGSGVHTWVHGECCFVFLYSPLESASNFSS